MPAQPSHVPPGLVVDVDIYAPPGIEADFHQAWADLAADGRDLVWTPRNEGHWIALSGEALQAVQSDHERFSSRVIVLPKSVGELHGLIPTTLDPPEHRPYRLLLNDNLKPAAIRGLNEKIRSTAIDLIESFRAEGRCNFTEQYASVFPIRLFMALVGLPEADATQIRYWAECMTRPNPPIPFDAARTAFFAYLDPIVRERRATAGDDMLSRMLASDLGGRTLSHDEALSICTQVLIAGVDTVVNFLAFAMLELARNPETRAGILSHPQGVQAAVNELFRRFGLVTIAREVRGDTNLLGIDLKAGDMVAMPTQVHGLDPKVNPDPLKIDFARPRPRHSAFGSGPHMCPGQELARSEVAITIEEWLKRIPDFRVAADSDLTTVQGIVGGLRRVCLEWDVS